MNFVLFFTFLATAATTAVLLRKLTPLAGAVGAVLGCLVYFGLGWKGVSLMGIFFMLGTGATSWKKRQKQALGLKPENKSGRTVTQVLANGGAGGLCGAIALFVPQHADLCLLLCAAAFSSAAADTVSSELGSFYGRRYFDILTFKKGTRGDDGVVSIEGFLAGIAASIVVAAVYASMSGGVKSVLWIVLAGTLGNLTDSVLGATLERNKIIGNDVVNFLNTAVAALLVFLAVRL